MTVWRKLRKEETDLIATMVRSRREADEILCSLSERLVEDLKDGGMGSLRFKDSDERDRRSGEKIAEAEFTDEDGIPVSAVQNLDNSGELFELDLWKVDLSSQTISATRRASSEVASLRPDADVGPILTGRSRSRLSLPSRWATGKH